MKKVLILMLTATVILSCSNDQDLLNDENHVISSTDEPEKILTFEEVLALADEYYLNDPAYLEIIKQENKDDLISLRAITTKEIEVTGYTSSKVIAGMANQKLMFATAVYGLSAYTVYIMDYYEVEKRVLLPSNTIAAYEVASSNCGFHPGVSGGRGYISYKEGNYFIMRTNLMHVKSDILGRTYNIWAPVTREALKWKYGIVLN